MKLKSLLLMFCLSLFSNVFAANMHLHPKADSHVNGSDAQSAKKEMNYPGFCQIEIINDSFTDVRVFGTFDDYSTIDFNIYRYEAPHYISLYYYGYCHNGMYINIQSPFSTVFSGWVNVDSTVRILPFKGKQAKADVSSR